MGNYLPGPHILNIQTDRRIARTKPYKVVVATEFFSSGADSYNIFIIDDVKEPFKISTSVHMMNPKDWAIYQDVAFVEKTMNKYGMVVGVKHAQFTKFNATQQQVYSLPMVVR